MGTGDTRSAMKKSICANVDFEELGINEYLVHTGFTYHDGDELHIILRQEDGQWKLTDEGHTMMWLSYEDFNMTESRKRQFDRAISQNNVNYESGRIFVYFSHDDQAGPALYSLVQAMLQIADLRYLDRTTVASTFMDDMKNVIKRTSFADQCYFNKKIELKNNEVCEPDVYIDTKVPILVFGISNSDRAQKALIDIMALNESKTMDYRLIIVIDDDVSITKKNMTMLINRTDKSIIGIDGIVDGINRFGAICV